MAEDMDDSVYNAELSREEYSGFSHAFLTSCAFIMVSELGDKTFFIATILAMNHSRILVLSGAMSANFLMIIVAGLIGCATAVIPSAVTHYVSTVLLAIFGVKMLKEALQMLLSSDGHLTLTKLKHGTIVSHFPGMDADEAQEEYEEAQAEIRKKEDEDKQSAGDGHIWTWILSPVFLKSFTLTFLGEWGDRSLFATIALGAREGVLGVITGGLLGHTLCTGLAVTAGSFIGQRISVRTVTGIGGILFLVLSATALMSDSD